MRSRLDERSLAWAGDLSATLKQWRAANGYTGSALAAELRIKATTWKHIQAGDAISPAEIYAKIYLRTHLAEANPCDLPAHWVTVPKRAPIKKERAWTIQQYQNWLSKQSKPKPALTPRSTAVANTPAQDRMERLLEKLFAEVQQLRMEMVLTSGSGELELLIGKVTAAMNLAIIGTAADRERFFARYGTSVATLLPLADALSEKIRAEREKKSARIREFGEVQV